MSIRRTTNNNPNNSNYDFPILMMLPEKGMIVMFNGESSGIVVKKGESVTYELSVGVYAEDWDISSFVPFNGVVELTNE